MTTRDRLSDCKLEVNQTPQSHFLFAIHADHFWLSYKSLNIKRGAALSGTLLLIAPSHFSILKEWNMFQIFSCH